MPKNFIALTSEIYKDKLILLNTSAGKQLFDPNGISTDAAIEFLWNLKYLKKGANTVFICYAFSRDNEFIFSGLPKHLKDKLFQNFRVRNELELLNEQKERCENDIYQKGKISKSIRDISNLRERINVLNKEIQLLKSVYHNGCKISLANGKLLTLNKNETSFSIYDIVGFFNKLPLYEAVKLFLNEDIPLLVRETFETLPLMELGHLEAIRAYSDLEVKYIARLMENVDLRLGDNGIFLSRYFGASAITTYLLSQIQAKKEFHNYKKARTKSPELAHAEKQAFYGNRSEQLKIGVFDNVNYYDMNSAYANAARFLPKMLKKPEYQKEWDASPFSMWHIEYDLPKELYFGLLPNRDTRQSVKYKLRGKGYFWQPEVLYLLHYFPECVEVNGGFVLEYEKAIFTQGIEVLYALRQTLKQANDPIEKILKLALASIYGKFCQHNGRGTYYNLFYAGFITSTVRANLLNATRGNEAETIAFSTDAIHTTANLENDESCVTISDELDGFKMMKAAKGIYLANGIHILFDENGNVLKAASQGYSKFNFDAALLEFQKTGSFNSAADFFVGHNLATLDEVSSWGKDWRESFPNAYRYPEKYLKILSNENKISPLSTSTRKFEAFNADSRNLNSKVIDTYSGLESAIYQHSNMRESDLAIDSLFARRI